MDRGAAVAMTAVAGGLIAVQAPINARLGAAVGSVQSALLSFSIGTVALLVIASLAKGGLGQLGEARGVPILYFTGGLLGAVYVTTALVAVRTLGAGGVTAATIAGQLTLAVIVDQFGWVGVEKQPLTITRLAGVALLIAGVFLVVRD